MSVADLPSCALECLLSAIANSTCVATDTACTCSNAALKSQSTLCSEESCTMVELLTTQNITNTICGVEPRYDDSWFFPSTVLLGFMIFVVGLRCLARITLKMAFWWDDYMNILAAATVVAAYTIVAGPMEFNGFGHDIWAVTPGKIVAFLKYYYIVSLVYLVARLAIRVSIVLFYSRVFSTPEHRLKIRITQIINIGLSFAFFMVFTFQCIPVRYYWNRIYDMQAGHCIDMFDFVWAAFTLLIAFDFWIIAIPLPIIAKLQLPVKKKLLIAIMFTTGLAAIGVGSAKLAYVGMFTRTTNPTYDNMPMLRLCCIEIQLGVICSCMPSMPMLFRPFTDYVRTKSETAKRFDSGYANAPERMSSSKPYSEGTSYSTTYSRSADIPEAQGIRMMTNIHQSTSYWRVESDKNVLLREMPISQESV